MTDDKWIKIGDDFPPILTDVLCYKKGEKISIGYWEEGDEGKVWIITNWPFTEEPTHWKHLPKGPKDE